jgi:Protein of unknown function (DUF1565)
VKECFRVAILLFALTSAANATDYYVATTGSDSNTGTQASPFLTITHAYNLAVPGDRVLVNPGTYTDYTTAWGLKLTTNGTAANPITVKSITRGAAIIDGTGQQATRPACFYLYGTLYNIIDGFTIRNCNIGVALYANGSIGAGNNKVINNEIYNISTTIVGSTGQGGQGISSLSPDHDNYYAQNYIHDVGSTWDDGFDHGMYVGGTNDSIVNNILSNNARGAGIQLAAYANVGNMTVYHNTLANNGWDGITVWSTGGSFTGLKISNNVVYNSRVGIRGCSAVGDVTLNNNISYGNSVTNYNTDNCGGGTMTWTNNNLLQSNPLFVNNSSDFHLQGGSPAIGSGVSLSGIVTIDFSGNPRPSPTGWDIGAYDSTTTSCP